MAKKNSRQQKRKEQIEYNTPFESEDVDEQPRIKYKLTMAYILDQDEVNSLVNASLAEYVEPIGSETSTIYTTYTKAEVVDLVDGTYHPRKSKKK